MNKVKRGQLQKVIDKLGEVKVDIEKVLNQEQEDFDNLSECAQASSNGQKMVEAIENLEAASDFVDDVIEYVEEAKI